MKVALCLCLLTLLVLAAVEDVRTRRIPNVISASTGIVAAFLVWATAGAAALPLHLGVAAVVFGGGFLLFNWNIMGGGDVKLYSAVALLAGPSHLLSLLLVTSLAGGALAVGHMVSRTWWVSQFVSLLRPSAECARAGAVKAPQPGRSQPAFGTDQAPNVQRDVDGLPYGVAIVAGALFVLAEFMRV